MCDVQGKLVAWLDGELSADEAVVVERHVEACGECRDWLAKYKRMGASFEMYCDGVAAANTRRRVLRWVPLLGVAAAAAGVAFLIFARTRVEPPPVVRPTTTAVSVPVDIVPPALTESRRGKTVHRRHVVAPGPVKGVNWQPMETAVQIAIPAEAMFPPGAMPKGMNFVAELSIAPDGSVKQVRLRQ